MLGQYTVGDHDYVQTFEITLCRRDECLGFKGRAEIAHRSMHRWRATYFQIACHQGQSLGIAREQVQTRSACGVALRGGRSDGGGRADKHDFQHGLQAQSS